MYNILCNEVRRRVQEDENSDNGMQICLALFFKQDFFQARPTFNDWRCFTWTGRDDKLFRVLMKRKNLTAVFVFFSENLQHGKSDFTWSIDEALVVFPLFPVSAFIEPFSLFC